jgi:hypothetical protein
MDALTLSYEVSDRQILASADFAVLSGVSTFNLPTPKEPDETGAASEAPVHRGTLWSWGNRSVAETNAEQVRRGL